MQPRSEGLLTAFSVGSPAVTTAAGIRIIQRLVSDVVVRVSPRRNDSSSRWEDERVYLVSTMCFPVSPVVFICRYTIIQRVPVPQETTESRSRHIGGLVRVFGLDRVPSAGCDEL